MEPLPWLKRYDIDHGTAEPKIVSMNDQRRHLPSSPSLLPDLSTGARSAREKGAENRDRWNKTTYAAAEQSIRRNSRTFYFATALLPASKKRAIRALYAFCRATDDLVDVQHASCERMEAWRAEVRQEPEFQRDPILYLWAATRCQYPIDPRYENDLISGVMMDLTPRSYATWDELARYCYHVASTVGLLSIPIIGLRPGTSFEQAASYATQLGIALQLTNILRDIGEDAARGQVYLPEADLAQFGLTRGDILSGVNDGRFHALMKFEIERARRLYAGSLPGISLLSRSGQLAVGTAALLYRAILDEIEAIHYGVYRMRAHTSGWKKLAMLPQILATVLKQKAPIRTRATSANS
jgi:15-cis-phytoene synthase